MSQRAYRAGYQAARDGLEYLWHRDGLPYASDTDNTKYCAGWIAWTTSPVPEVQDKIEAQPTKERAMPEHRITLDSEGVPKTFLYHAYDTSGKHLGDVKEFSARGALLWAAFWFEKAKDAICVSDVWIEPEVVARMNAERGRN